VAPVVPETIGATEQPSASDSRWFGHASADVYGKVMGAHRALDGLSNGVVANSAVGVQQNVLADGLTASPVAYGQLPLVNPLAGVTHYGYDTSNGGFLTQDGKVAFPTEPDKNVYLVTGSRQCLYLGYEGVPNDSGGNFWLVEDIRGRSHRTRQQKCPRSDWGHRPRSPVLAEDRNGAGATPMLGACHQ
jgi:hypothetical protein